MVAPGYTPTPDDDAPSGYQPGGRRRRVPLTKRYNLAPTKRGTKSRGARYAIHRKKIAKRRRFQQMPLIYETAKPPEWWTEARARLIGAGWEVSDMRSQVKGADNKDKYLSMPRCRCPGGLWYYPESARDVEWLIASTRAGRRA